MAIFTFGDTVRVKTSAPETARPGAPASVVMVHEAETRRGAYFDQFPDGAVYTIEFEDGASIDLHESSLEKGTFPGEREDDEVA